MQNKQAIYVIGNPGSGKDVIIRDIISNYNVVEYTSTTIESMLSDDASFKRAKTDKKDALLYRESIIVTANAYDLSFILTKQILEHVGYTTHLIFVESDLSVAVDRLHNRPNIKESLDRISIGNSNKSTIINEFKSNVIVDNSKTLDLTEVRLYINNILNDLKFESDMTIDQCVKTKGFKDRVKKSKAVPDTRMPGEVGTVSFINSFESIDSPANDSPILGAGTVQDVGNRDTKAVLSKTKKIIFKHKVYPNGI